MTRWLVALSLCALSGCAAPFAGDAQPIAPPPPTVPAVAGDHTISTMNRPSLR
jgi:hypothetical protein